MILNLLYKIFESGFLYQKVYKLKPGFKLSKNSYPGTLAVVLVSRVVGGGVQVGLAVRVGLAARHHPQHAVEHVCKARHFCMMYVVCVWSVGKSVSKMVLENI